MTGSREGTPLAVRVTPGGLVDSGSRYLLGRLKFERGQECVRIHCDQLAVATVNSGSSRFRHAFRNELETVRATALARFALPGRLDP